MAIKYVVLPEKRQVVAILKNTKYDAYNKAIKICKELSQGQSKIYLCPDPEKLMMPNSFKVRVTCDENDIFDENIGKEKAKERLMAKYYKSLDKRIDDCIADIGVIKRQITVYKV